MFKQFDFVVLAAILQLFTDPAQADLIVTTVAGQSVATSLQQALGATDVHLHSLGALANGSYYAPNAASIKVPRAITGGPGQRTYFSLPDESKTLLGFRYGYYVNHVRSSGVFVSANPDSFTISITLMSDGPALVGTCLRVRTGQACGAAGITTPPNIEWRDARIDIVAKPIVVQRSLGLDVQTVTIGGEFDVGQVCEWPLIGKQLCAAVSRQSQRLRMRIGSQVRDAMNTDGVHLTLAAGVRQYIDTVLNEPLLGVRRVSMQDGQVTIGLGLGR